MSPQSVSLPSIHELFPEHLMNSPPSATTPSSSRARPHDAQNSCSPQLRALHQGPPSSGPSHPGSQRQAEEYSLHGRRATLRAPGSSSKSVDALSSRLSHSTSMDQDNYQGCRPAFPPPVPGNYSAREQAGPDRRTYLNSQLPLARPDLWPNSHSASLPHGLNDSESLTDDETPQGGSPSGVPRKHVCPICRKAFNRPSSLKIHYNTHTGATPFRCPWPRCGREFNVNSNMRRHLRNHTVTSGQEAPDDGIRRRRRRSSTNSLQSAVTMQEPVSTLQPHGSSSRHQAPPPQYSIPSLSESSHHYMRYRVYDYPKDYQRSMDPEEVDEYHASEDPHRHMRMVVPVTQGLQPPVVEPRGNIPRHNGLSVPQEDYHSHHRSHSGSSASIPMRALTPGSSFHSSSPSPSPSPSASPTSSSFNSPPPSTYASPSQSPALQPRQQHQMQYSPSMPYLRGTRDSHVSTALRPVSNPSRYNVPPRQ